MTKNAATPKVSIVLPTYNGAKYIRQSIDSCLNQTYSNIELIIVDDGSTDEAPDVVKSYRDDRIRYIRHERNLGLPNALNSGFAKAAGDYLTWTSDDNYYSEKAIATELAYLIEKKASFVYCDFYKFSDEKPSELELWRLDDKLALERINGVGPCILYSRSVKEAVGDYDTLAMLAEDYDYWIRVSKKFQMQHLSEPLYYYREHSDSLSLSRFYQVRAMELLIKSKNHVLTDQAVDYFASLCARKYTRLFFIRRLAKQFLKTRIRGKLRDYESGRLRFTDAKSALKDFVNVD